MEEFFRVFFVQRRAVDHDHAAGLYAFTPGPRRIADVRIGHVHGQVVAVTLFAPVEPVESLRGALVAFTQLRPLGLLAQRDAVGFQRRAGADQLQAPFRLEDQDFVDEYRMLGFELERRGRDLFDRLGHDRFGKRCLGHRCHTEAEKGKQPAHETISLKTRCWVTRRALATGIRCQSGRTARCGHDSSILGYD
ncbi:hypothetical protein D9M73_182120 [compost metagenome]